MVKNNRINYVGVPEVRITLLDGKALGDINREEKFNATVTMTNGAGNMLSEFPSNQLFNGNLQIKGRGNTTWTNGYPKRPYNITICDNAFKKLAFPLFGMPAHSAWTLLAEWEDRTHVRTLTASAFSYAFGLPWASRGLKVRLFINNDFRGLYTLCEKVERDVNRINVSKLDPTQITMPNITGGYVPEAVYEAQIDASEKKFFDSLNKSHTFKVPDAVEIADEQVTYIQNAWNDVLNRIFNVSLSDVDNGYRAVVDVPSSVRYYLLHDLVKSSDAYMGSWYFTKERSDPKFKHGPFWDANGIFGLWDAHDERNLQDPTGFYIGEPYKCTYYGKLATDPYFAGEVEQMFKACLTNLHLVIADLDLFMSQLYASGAIEEDRTAFPQAVNSGLGAGLGAYGNEKSFYLGFIKKRLFWFTRSAYDIVPPKAVN